MRNFIDQLFLPAIFPAHVQGELTTTAPNAAPRIQLVLAGSWTLSDWNKRHAQLVRCIKAFVDPSPEATWGADPLESYGGFRNLKYDPEATFPSSYATNGSVKWTVVEADKTGSTSSGTNTSLTVGFPDVNWTFLQTVYGWAAVQYQAWARGELFVNGNDARNIVLYTDSILEFWVDDVHYFGGDFYTYRNAPPVLHLKPGSHTIDIRLVRDVRAMGGIGCPTIAVLVDAQVASGALELARERILIADIVDGVLASPYASAYVRNTGTEDIAIRGLRSPNLNCQILHQKRPFVVRPGQTRPLAFSVSLRNTNVSSVQINVLYNSSSNKNSSLVISQDLVKRSIYSPHKITFLHSGFIVSYAILRPPSRNATCGTDSNATFPVLLQLHGAGLEADNDQVAHALDPVPDICAWVVFPTGVTPWSGDDWHNWGFADVEQAVASIPAWIVDHNWLGPGVDIERWIMSGHSNGGQGTWYALTHRPSKVIAAAPVSGYASIQKYVPFELWQPADPRRTAIISASLNSYRHEMLMDNAKGIPILQQHGGIDDNVPTYHSRFLRQLLMQAGATSTYNEIPGANHWFDGVMTTDPLIEFYRTQVTQEGNPTSNLQNFSLVVGTPGDTASKSGIRVLQLVEPGQYGRVDVTSTTNDTFSLRTSNVLSIELASRFLRSGVLSIDGQRLSGTAVRSSSIQLFRTAECHWQVGPVPTAGGGILPRRGRQLGAMDALLRTNGPFTIRHLGPATYPIALQASRNLHQYFSADSVIEDATVNIHEDMGNIITIATGADLPNSAHLDFPVQVAADGVNVRDSEGITKKYAADGRLAAAFLRPLGHERLELVIWGVDQDSLSLAARFVPMVTGVGQPDLIVLGDSTRWKGVQGAVCLGFFDHKWSVTKGSFLE